MATPSGQISLNDVNVELGIPGTTVITMNDANVRTLAGVGGSGTVISMQNLQNKSNRVTASATISSDTANYVLNTAKASGYSAGTTDMTLTINSGVTVYSSSTGSYAFTVDTSWASGDTVTIVNNGVILGRGGDGGAGAVNQNIYGGNSGGPALLVQRALTMNNLGRISGGGGGGGGGANGVVNPGTKTAQSVGGGGGGGGIGISSGGSGGFTGYAGSAGQPGTLTAAGNGGTAGFAGQGGNGGNGGGYGSSGSSGGSSIYYGGGGGGSAGACIAGNSNITYTNTGTRNGSIS